MRPEQSQKLQSSSQEAGYHRHLALLVLTALLIFGRWELTRGVPGVHAQAGAPRQYLSPAREFPTSYRGSATAQQAMSAGASALSMAAGDLFGDGIGDLAVGFVRAGGGLVAIHHGNLDAFAPQSDSTFWAITNGNNPSPYLPQADLVAIPVRPDFLTVGDLIGFGGGAVAAAARGGNTISVLSRGDSGSVELLQTITVSGAITGMGAHKLAAGKYGHLAVGVHTAAGSRLQIYTGSTGGLSKTGDFPISGDATSFASSDLDGDGVPDLLFVAGGQVSILHSFSQTLQPVATPFTVSSAALGSFLFDRDPMLQMALLATDGSLHIWARTGLDSTPRTPAEIQAMRTAALARAQAKQPNSQPAPATEQAVVWKEVENDPGVGVPDSSGKTPLMFRTRVSSSGTDDVLLLSSAKVSVVAHPTFQPGQAEVQDNIGPGADAVAAVPARVSVDPRQGVVYVESGDTAPHVMIPHTSAGCTTSSTTFCVNRTDDPPASSGGRNGYCIGGATDCSLRQAIVKFNYSASGSYTISVPKGLYTLTLARAGSPAYDATTGTLDVGLQGGPAQTVAIVGGTTDVSPATNCVGSSPASDCTVVQGGTSLMTSVDKVFSFNQDENIYSNVNATVSGLTIQNGNNMGSSAGFDNLGGGFDFDTGVNGTNTLSLTNVTVNNNSAPNGNGGGFALQNFNGGSSTVTVTNCTIEGNSSANGGNGNGSEGNGGGISIENNPGPTLTTLTNTTVSNNTAGVSGGGIFLNSAGSVCTSTCNNTLIYVTLTLHSVTVGPGNTAGTGGGIWGESELNIDSSGTGTPPPVASIFNNTATAKNTDDGGGGLWFGGPGSETPTHGQIATLTQVNFTGNHSGGYGGGINVLSADASDFSMSYSRLHSNTASTAGGQLYLQSINQTNGEGPPSFTVTDNWWSSNSDPVTAGDIVAVCTSCISGAPTVTYKPWLGLTLSANPTNITTAQTSTLTAELETTSNGTSFAAVSPTSQLAAFAGLPVTFAVTTGTGSASSPEDFASGSAASTFTPSMAGTPTVTATFDGVTTPATSITVTQALQPPSMTKSFSPTTVKPNTASTLTFNIDNGNSSTIQASFTDTLPTNMQVASTPAVSSTCAGGTGAVTATASATSISYTTSSLAAGTCSISVNVIGTVDNTYNNSVTLDSSNAGNATSPATATLTVINPPTLVKSFSPTSVAVNGITTMTIALSSTNTNLTLSGVAFNDTLPAGLAVASPSNLNSTCSGTDSATTNVTLTNASLSPGANCSITVSMKGTAAGSIVNSVTPTSTNGGTGTAGSATLTVVAPPTISKSFGASTIALNTNTSLSFTLANTNASTNTTLHNIGFTDNLPAGLVVATPNGLAGSCGGGTISATGGGTQVSLSGASLPGTGASTSCTFTVNVTGIAAGVQNNVTTAVTSTEGGNGLTASASINVEAPPSISKSFNPTVIGVDASSTLTFTITNPTGNPASLTGVGFTDTLPTGLSVATAGPTATCGGSLSTTALVTIALSNATVAVGTPCTFTVSVKGNSAGSYTNTTGNVTSSNGGMGNTASADLTVSLPPMLTKSFSPTSVPLNGTSTMTITVTNPNSSLTLTNVGFSDNLPSGMEVATPSNLSTTCTGSQSTTSSNVTLSGAMLAGGASCNVVVTVQGTTAGASLNSVAATSANAGTGTAGTATLTVEGPPTISKAFELVNQIAASPTGATESGGTVTITTTNPHGYFAGQSVTISGVGVAGYDNTFTIASTPTPTTFTYTDTNTGLAASGGGTATVPESTMPLNSTVTLAFTLTNPNGGTSLTGVGFTDSLPAGLQVATTPNASAPCGTFTPNAGDTTLTFSGGTLAASGTCTVTVDVTATTVGAKNNTTDNVTSNEGGLGGTASASITVLAAPSISKAFGTMNLSPGGTTTLTFTITNPNGANQLLGVAFTDPLPSGLAVAATPGASTSCGGTFAPSANDTTLTFSGGTIAAASNCTVAVNVTATGTGAMNNTTGNVTSANAGTGNTASASVTVASAPSITKAFSPTTVLSGGSSTLTLTITNPNSSLALTGVTFADTFPSGMVLASNPGTSNNGCGGSIVANGGAGSVTLTNGAVSASQSCSISVTVVGNTVGTLNNSVQVSSTNGGTGNTANASLTVLAALTIGKSFNPTTVEVGGNSTLTITVTNPNSSAVHNVQFSDTMPSGITLITQSGGTCGTVGGTGGGNTLINTGAGTVSSTSTTLGAGASCNVTLTVQGASTGMKLNTTGAVSSNETGTNGTASATLTVNAVAPPTISKSFSPNNVAVGVNSQLSFTLTNPNTTVSLSSVAFTDNLPTGMTVASAPNVTGSCGGGTITATANSSSVSLTGATLPANGTCTFFLNVVASVGGTLTNTTQAVTSTEGGMGLTATANLNVEAPPSISKSFSPTGIAVGATSSLTFTITNPAGNPASLTGVGFSDTLPTGLTVTSATSSQCGGTLTVTSPVTIQLAGAAVVVGTPCTFSVTVTGATAGSYTNTTGNVNSTNGGTGNTASANLAVASAPQVAKSFVPASVALGGTSTLTIAIGNPNAGIALAGLAFTDTLPSGMVVASSPGVNNTCGGTVTAVGGASSVSLSGGSLSGAGPCDVSVSVQGNTAGTLNNSVQVTSTNAGLSNTASASLMVEAPPSISKSFGAATIALNASTNLTFTITNPAGNPSNLSGVGFTDMLPTGLTVATASSSQCGGSLVVTAPTSIQLSGANFSAPCIFAVSVTGAAAGSYTNTTGNVTSANGGTGNTATAMLNVEAPPSISKAFSPTTIAPSGTSSLTFTITNPSGNPVSLTGVGFSDTLPTGLTVTSATTSQCGGTLTVTSPVTIALSGATVVAGTPCTFSVTVTGATSGSYTNTTGNVTSSNGGTGNTATAMLAVGTPPSIAKSFSPTTVAVGGTSTLTFNITNPSASFALTGVGFTDTLPSGMVLASNPAATNTCAGSTLTANGGAGLVALSGGSLAGSGTCSVTVVVQGNTAGTLNNAVQVTSTNAGTGNTATATLMVEAPPSISKSFGAATIGLNNATNLTFTITNPAGNPATLTGVAFSDMLPTGLTVTTATTSQCGGTLTVTSPVTIALAGASVATGSPCMFSVSVTGAAAGSYTNTTGNVSSSNGGTGNTATAMLNVEAPPSIAKAFSPTTIAPNGTTSLTFTITNPAGNPVSLPGVGFTDILPTGLTVASATSSQCGGTLTVTAPVTIQLSGATVATGSPCTFSVTVTGVTAGNYTNTTGAVFSTSYGTGNTATAMLSVASAASISKSFTPSSVAVGGTSTLTFSLSNSNASFALSGVAFTDTFPTGMVLASNPNSNNTCGGSLTATGGAGSVMLSGGSLAGGGTCSVTVTVQGNTGGTLTNSVQVTTSNAGTGNTATASLMVEAPPMISKSFGAGTIGLNASTNLSFTITNPAGNPATLTGVGFTDMLPTGLTVTTASSSTCGGTLTVTSPVTIALSGASVATGSPCTFNVAVTGAASGSYTNTTGNVTSTNGGTGNTATANVVVASPPSISKGFSPGLIALGGTSTLTYTINNPNTGFTVLGVAFTDSFPSGMVVASTPAVTNTCGGSVTANAGASSVVLSGGAISGASCAVTVSVQGNAAGTLTNSAQVTSGNAGTGNTASANLMVEAPPSISKAFSPTAIAVGTTSNLTFTITNPAGNPVSLSGVGFTDMLPSGLTVATATTSQCGGTLTVTAPVTIQFSGATVATGSPCTFNVTVTGGSVNTYTNTTGNVTSSNGGTGNTASSTLFVGNPATVTNITSSTANGTYGVNAMISIQVTFSSTVTVTGTPTLTLNSGGTASYTMGSGTTTLTFLYTVAAGQTTSGGHLDASSTTALSGTIKDSNMIQATLTLPAGGSPGSLSFNKAIVIDTTPPQVVSYSVLFGTKSYNVIGSGRFDLPWQVTGIQVVFSKPIAQANANSLSGVSVTAFAGLGTNTLTWTISAVNDAVLSTMLAGSGANAIADAEGNPLAGGSGFSQTLNILWGDYNGDGVVNAQDLVGVGANESTPYNIFADVNGDGVVNAADVQIVRLRIGTSLP